jgi:hypothetical protein
MGIDLGNQRGVAHSANRIVLVLIAASGFSLLSSCTNPAPNSQTPPPGGPAKPSLVVTTPAAASVFINSTSIAVAGSASVATPDSIASVEASLNGGAYAALANTAWSDTIHGLDENAANTVLIRARTAAGIASDPVSLSITTDTVNPGIDSVTVQQNAASGANGWYPRSGTCQATAVFSDNLSGVLPSSVQAIASSSAYSVAGSKTASSPSGDTYSFDLDLASLAAAGTESPCTIRCQAQDRAGNSAASGFATLKIDDKGPTISCTPHTPVSAGSSWQNTAIITDYGSGLDLASIKLTIGSTDYTPFHNGPNSFTFTITMPSTPGSYNLVIHAADALQNVSDASYPIQVN